MAEKKSSQNQQSSQSLQGLGGQQSSQGALSRRSFLKAAGVAAGAAGLAGAASMTTAGGWLAPAQAHAETEERTAHLPHQFHCFGKCNLKCTIRDERVVSIEPNPHAESWHRKICLRGLSEVQHIYSSDRLQTPLKRVGERGDGEFVAITWDEAIGLIADALKESQQKYGEGSVFLRKSTEASVGFDFIGPLLHADQGGNWGLDRGSANGMAPAFGAWAFLPQRSHKEFSDAATIIEIGHNPLESGIQWARHLLDAKDAGAYIVVVDPRFSPTASKGDQWLPVLPATDAALIQGMIRTIVDKGWYDEEFMKENTSFTHLVSRATGKQLRSDTVMCPNPAVVSKSPEGDPVGAPYVYDEASGEPRLYDEAGIEPALEGTWSIDGEEYATVFSLMKEWIADYSTSWAAQKCGIDEQSIVDLADRYANNGPAIIDFGLGGPDKYTNADVLGHSLSILTALTGNFGKKGAGLGYYAGAGVDDPSATLGAWELPEEYKNGDTGLAMYDMPYEENNIHVALTYGDAFTLEAANANDMLEWVKNLDFFAIVDIYHSSIVDYADVVLPACTKFECEENVKQLRDNGGYVSLACGMVPPLFESKSDLQIERLLAAQWGLENLIPKTYEELARHCLKDVDKLDPRMRGITYDALLENGGIMALPETGDDYFVDGFADQVYATPSTKIELYYEYLVSQNHQFPVYEDADEAYEENPQKAEYPLYFMQGKTRYRIHAYYSASQWMQEDYGPSVNISPVDAQQRGIKTGDDVRVFNGRGSFVCKALVNESQKPGVLFMAETTYNRYYKEGFLQNVTNSTRNERCRSMYFGPQVPYNDVLVQVEKA